MLQLPHPSLPPVPPLWREGLIGLEWAALRRSDVYRGVGVPAGDGRGVLLVPGFLAGDGSLATLTHWLRAAGWRTKRAGIRANVSCSEVACGRLEERLERLADSTGDRVTIIGQSRGGVLAKALAVRRPDLVAAVVGLGAPVRAQLAVHPLVLAQVGVVATLGRSGAVPGLMSWRCLRGPCCAAFRAALAGPFPAGVRYLSVYSRRDGIVDWRSCIDPDATCVEVRGSHCGMSVNADVYRAIGSALGGVDARDDGWAQAA